MTIAQEKRDLIKHFAKNLPQALYSSCLYRITNNKNGKSYIGRTDNVVDRIVGHFFGRNGCPMLDKDLNTDWSYVKWEILAVGNTEYIIELEKKAIVNFKTYGEGGYNIQYSSDARRSVAKAKKKNPDVDGFKWNKYQAIKRSNKERLFISEISILLEYDYGITISPAALNTLLVDIGMITRDEDKNVFLTESGKEYGIEYDYMFSIPPKRNVEWYPSIIEVLRSKIN